MLELGARGEVGLDGVLRQMDELPGSVEVLEAVVGVGLYDVVVWTNLVAPESPDFPVEGALAAAAAPNEQHLHLHQHHYLNKRKHLHLSFALLFFIK